MTKRILCTLLCFISLLSTAGCGETRTLHCDGCGIGVEVDADSNMDEDWIIFCEECGKEIDDPTATE